LVHTAASIPVRAAVWTNTPQNVTLRIWVEDVGTGQVIAERERTVELRRGVNLLLDVLPATVAGEVDIKAACNITAYQQDTDPRNNIAYSDVVRVRIRADVAVLAFWRPVKQRAPWLILPGDVVEVSIMVRCPVEVATQLTWSGEGFLPAQARWWRAGRTVSLVGRTVWYNFTVEVPWTDELVIRARASTPLEGLAGDENVTLRIPVDPDVSIERVEAPQSAAEGATAQLQVYVLYNVRDPELAVEVLIDGATAARKVLYGARGTVGVVMPPNDWLLPLLVRRPTQERTLLVTVAGPDSYPGNEAATVSVTVTSTSWLWLLLLMLLSAAVIIVAALRGISRAVAVHRREYWVRG